MPDTEGEEIQVVLAWGDPSGADRVADSLRSTLDAEVVAASDPESAGRRLAGGGVDCVVSDHDPPNVNATALLEALDPGDPPVVLSTAGRVDDVARRAVDAGVAALLPRNGDEGSATAIAQEVRDAVRQHRERRETSAAVGRFGALAQNLPDAVVVVDADGVVQYANPALERILGYEPPELRGRPLSTLVPDRLAADHRSGFEEFLATGERTVDWTGVEFPAETADGEELPVEVSFGDFRHRGKLFLVGSIRERSGR